MVKGRCAIAIPKVSGEKRLLDPILVAVPSLREVT
jgi:hypothetical protein